MIEFKVEGMSCQHCVAAVTRSVHEVDPTAKVEVNLEAGSVSIDSRTAVESLERAIDDAGYSVTSTKTA